MKVQTRRFITLDDADRCELVRKAKDIDQGLSTDEYIDYIETFISRVVDLLDNKT